MLHKSVLIVDDDPDVLMVLVNGLKALGEEYLFDTADNGDSALQKIKTNHYDLIITDYMMPGMNGATLVQYVRKLSPDTQIVMMSAIKTDGLQDVIHSLKLQGHVHKPLQLREIREIVKSVVGHTVESAPPQENAQQSLQNEDEIGHQLRDLQTNTGARCVLLISQGGHPVSVACQQEQLDIVSISALVAANFMAATELARLLGNNSIFKSSFHEGPDYDIFAHDINGDFLLAVIFGAESKAGVVRFYTSKALQTLTNILHKETVVERLEEGFVKEINQELDSVFS